MERSAICDAADVAEEAIAERGRLMPFIKYAHPVWFNWDGLIGTISKSEVGNWGTLYQKNKPFGTLMSADDIAGAFPRFIRGENGKKIDFNVSFPPAAA